MANHQQHTPSRRRRGSRILGLVFGILVLLGCWPAAVHAAPKTDIVILVNGDVITCEIKEMVRGKVRASTDHMGTIYIEWDKVARVTSNYWFLVSLKNGSLVYGQMSSADKEGSLVVSFQDKSVILGMGSIVEIQPIRYEFWEKFDLAVAFGLNWTKASEVLQTNFNASAEYKGQLYSWGLSGSSMFTEQGEGDITRRNQLDLFVERELNGRLSGSLDSGLYRNDELGIRLRLNGGANLGYYLVRSSHLEFQTYLGASLNREWGTADAPASNNAEARVGTDFRIFYYDSPKTDLTVTMDVYPNLTQSGRVRFESSIAARHELFKDLFLKLQLYESRDNKPPAGANAKDDRGIVFSLEWSK